MFLDIPKENAAPNMLVVFANYTSKLNDLESTGTSILSVQIYHSSLKKRSFTRELIKTCVTTREREREGEIRL